MVSVTVLQVVVVYVAIYFITVAFWVWKMEDVMEDKTSTGRNIKQS